MADGAEAGEDDDESDEAINKKMAKDLDTHRPSEAPRVYHYTFEELTKDATDLLGQPSMNRSTDVHHVVVLKPKLGPSNVALHVKQ
uniref:SFRICE_023308 n=1 Tax=Spodoptera frugiperda TaxID=7108 RepID=A0A2H1WTM2_SPOFR